MNSPAHVVLNALVLGRRDWRDAWLPITAGALMPDLPMIAFYIYHRLLGTPDSLIFGEIYFEPGWQLLFNVFNSIPLLVIAGIVAWRFQWPRLLAFLASMLLHCLSDLPLHHDDGHAHFMPLSGWVFESPVSYWDPEYYGRIAAPLEMILVVLGSILLIRRSQNRAWRRVGGITLAAYVTYIGFAIRYWIQGSPTLGTH